MQFMCTPAMITVIGGFGKGSKCRVVAVGHCSRKLEDNDTMFCEATWL